MTAQLPINRLHNFLAISRHELEGRNGWLMIFTGAVALFTLLLVGATGLRSPPSTFTFTWICLQGSLRRATKPTTKPADIGLSRSCSRAMALESPFSRHKWKNCLQPSQLGRVTAGRLWRSRHNTAHNRKSVVQAAPFGGYLPATDPGVADFGTVRIRNRSWQDRWLTLSF
jgi:hypothetical protein